MARSPRTEAEAVEVVAAEPVEAETETVEAEAVEVAKLRFIVKTNRLFGFEQGQEIELAADEVRQEWLQHLTQVE